MHLANDPEFIQYNTNRIHTQPTHVCMYITIGMNNKLINNIFWRTMSNDSFIHSVNIQLVYYFHLKTNYLSEHSFLLFLCTSNAHANEILQTRRDDVMLRHIGSKIRKLIFCDSFIQKDSSFCVVWTKKIKIHSAVSKYYL